MDLCDKRFTFTQTELCRSLYDVEQRTYKAVKTVSNNRMDSMTLLKPEAGVKHRKSPFLYTILNVKRAVF